MTTTRRAEWLAAYNASLNGMLSCPDNPGFYKAEPKLIKPFIDDALAFADAALAAADERFPPAEPSPRSPRFEPTAPPWPEAGSSLPEGVGESVVKETCDEKQVMQHYPSVRALVEAARRMIRQIKLHNREHGYITIKKDLDEYEAALVPFSEPVPKVMTSSELTNYLVGDDTDEVPTSGPGSSPDNPLLTGIDDVPYGAWFKCCLCGTVARSTIAFDCYGDVGEPLKCEQCKQCEPAPKAKLPEMVDGKYWLGKISISEGMCGWYISGTPMGMEKSNPLEYDPSTATYCRYFPTAQAALDALVAEGLVKS